MCRRRLSIFLGLLLIHCCRSELNCTVWQAREYRDCFCGTEVLDFERHCHDEYTYYETTSHQDSLYCGFECSNGGTAELLMRSNGNYEFTCHCLAGYHGFCCELGKKAKKIPKQPLT